LITQPDIQALLNECGFQAVRSSGSGGQNVNKLSTKVILVFDVLNSRVLTDDQKQLMMEALRARISNEGLLQLNSSSERTQLGNRKKVEEKFEKLLEKAFRVKTDRIPTRPTKASKERRLKDKRESGRIKQDRGAGYTSSITDE